MPSSIPAVPTTILLLVASNVFIHYMRQPLKLDCLWSSLCMLGAVYFMFRR